MMQMTSFCWHALSYRLVYWKLVRILADLFLKIYVGFLILGATSSIQHAQVSESSSVSTEHLRSNIWGALLSIL